MMLTKISRRSKMLALSMIGVVLGTTFAALPVNAAFVVPKDYTFPLIDRGIYSITNKKTGRVMEVRGESMAYGASIDQWSWWNGNNQKWIARFEGNSTYSFKNVGSGLVLDVPGGTLTWGVRLQQWGYNGGSNQKWRLQYLSNGYFYMTNKYTELQADAMPDPDGKYYQGSPVGQWGYNGGDSSQFWGFTMVGTAY